jgi:dihydropyrimidine dehydrogenase (NADP+)
MKKAFDEGWGGVICKTLSLDAAKINNVTPRYGRLKASDGQVIGWENIELISDRPFETMLDDLKRLKQEYPDRCDNFLYILSITLANGAVITFSRLRGLQ